MSDQYFEFFCPVKIMAGYKALEHLPSELGQCDASRPMIVTDKGVVGAGLVKLVTDALEQAGIHTVEIYDEVPPDSSMGTVRALAHHYRARNCDSLIAIGGGSPIDTSKAANVLISEGGEDLSKYLGMGALTRPLRPFFIVPTTAGTGSEVTMVAVIKDEERGAKIPIGSHYLMPRAAIIDPRMTLSLPPYFTAATGMDAMTHAVEAYTCLQKNPASDAYATAAISAIAKYLLQVMDNPRDVHARLAMGVASTQAGIAFSNSVVGLVHALGHSLGALCHMHHGAAMSLFLPYVLEYNLPARSALIGELLLPLSGAEVYAATPPDQRPHKAIAAIRKLRDALHDRCQLPRSLSESGQLDRGQLEEIARLTIDDGSVLFNPVPVSYEDALSLLEKAW